MNAMTYTEWKRRCLLDRIAKRERIYLNRFPGLTEFDARLMAEAFYADYGRRCAA
jgi:hypothetical protein